MLVKFSFITFLCGLIMIFVLQVITYLKNFLINGGMLDGDATTSLLLSRL